ncbi:MAG: hydrogenase [Desulfobacterales bacterium]|nr:hydrogenase [Desulfobacterales bacterium]
MGLFYFSIYLFLIGGFLPIFLYKRFSLMKISGIVFISAGCLLSMIGAFLNLINSLNSSIAFKYFHNFSIAFKMDALSAFFTITICLICLLASIYSFHYLNHPEKSFRTAVSYFFYSFLVLSMIGVVNSDNILTFAFAWEMMSLTSLFLVIYEYEEKDTSIAGYLYFIFTHSGAMFIFASFGIIYSLTGNFDFKNLSNLSNIAQITIFVLAFIGFGAKAGVFPLHVWLPYAHPAAPSHVSAVMSGVMIKTGIYGILRIYFLLDTNIYVFGYIALIAGILSGVLGVVYALGQHDLKRLLAYHSVENIGIILIGLGIGMIGLANKNFSMAVLGFSGGLLHVLNHSIFKSLLFMGAGVVLQKSGSRSIEQLGGLMKPMKITGTTFLIGAVAISGLPPLNGFVSEFLIYFGSFKGLFIDNSAFVLSILAILSLSIIGGLALACFTKVVGIVFLGEPRSEKALKVMDENGITLKIPMIILSLFCFLIGIMPKYFAMLSFKVLSSFGIFLGANSSHYTKCLDLMNNISIMAFIFIIILLIIVEIRNLIYKGKQIGKKETWGCGFTKPTPKIQYTASSYAFSILEFYKPVAEIKQSSIKITDLFPKQVHFHSQVLDIAERLIISAIVKPILMILDKQRWIQHGDIHLYIGYILLAIIVLLFFV